MIFRKIASKKPTKYFRVIVDDVVVRVVDVPARSQKHAIKQVLKMPTWVLREIDHVTKITGTREITDEPEVDYLDEPILHSPLGNAEC